MKTIFIDTETTGIDTDRCGVYQIAGIIDVDEKTVEEFNLFCDIFPDYYVDPKVFDVGKMHITLEDIHKLPSPEKTFLGLKKILKSHIDKFDKKDKLIAIGYVADFDNRVLRRFFRKNHDEFFGSYFWHPWIDVMNLAMFVYQDKRAEIESFKLESMAKFMGINTEDINFHDAMADIKITREMYYSLL